MHYFWSVWQHLQLPCHSEDLVEKDLEADLEAEDLEAADLGVKDSVVDSGEDLAEKDSVEAVLEDSEVVEVEVVSEDLEDLDGRVNHSKPI